jgi:hypothetical protein
MPLFLRSARSGSRSTCWKTPQVLDGLTFGETVQNLGGTERVCHRALDSGVLRPAGLGFDPRFWTVSTPVAVVFLNALFVADISIVCYGSPKRSLCYVRCPEPPRGDPAK